MYRSLLIVALCLNLVGCATGQTSAPPRPEVLGATLVGDSAHPPAARWVRTELYLSLGPQRPLERQVSAPRWQTFLDQEVSTRFPDGFTVLDAYGQWRDKGATEPERLATKVLVILHEDTAARRQDIAAVRLAWKRLTGDLSVLAVSQPADVSF